MVFEVLAHTSQHFGAELIITFHFLFSFLDQKPPEAADGMILMDQGKSHDHRHLAAPAAFHSLGCSDAPYFTDPPAQRTRR
jgi:hypothetical protein